MPARRIGVRPTHRIPRNRRRPLRWVPAVDSGLSGPEGIPFKVNMSGTFTGALPVRARISGVWV